MKLSARLFLLSSSVVAASLEQPASDRHAQIRKLQRQSCAEGYSSFVGSGVVPLVSLKSTVKYSAHVCFDESSGFAVGEFFDSAKSGFEDVHVTYHVHCAARDGKGGIFFGAELDYMSEAVAKVRVLSSSSSGDLDASDTEERDLKSKKVKGKKTKEEKTTKAEKDKATKAEKKAEPSLAPSSQPSSQPIASSQPSSQPSKECGIFNGRRLQDKLGVKFSHANGEARKKRELGESPQGTLAILYFGSTSDNNEEKEVFGFRLFADYDHSCESFANQMKDIDMDDDLGPFVSGDFSIAGPAIN